MKRDILNRYERDEAGNSIIDVTANRLEDLYNNFDKSAPYIRRDLDGDLADYLIECARELGRKSFTIRFTLDKLPEGRKLSRIRRSLKSYFLYRTEIEARRLRVMLRRSVILFVAGLAVLAAIAWLDKVVIPGQSILGNVFGEGLMVVAWIALWEALATFLVEWFPHRRNVLLFRALARSQLIFRSTPAHEA